ncbi:MAG: DUF805 domain-containing protein [Hyphomicrobiales bacterium]|nr:DUF805 domain-containing protein [Hyphomicrobiales bacterium]
MRGDVLHYDPAQSFGFITGSDGNRYTFRGEDVRGSFSVSRGAAVEFRQSGDHARDVIEAPAASPPSVQAVPIPQPAGTRAGSFGRNPIAAGQAPKPTPSIGLWRYFWICLTARYAAFQGRARRKEYWAFVLFSTLALIVATLAGFAVDAALGNFDPYGGGPVAIVVTVGLAILAGLVPGIAVTVRRFHDVGMSGWFYLLFLVLSLFTIGGVIILVITLIPSQKRENRWGPLPDGVTILPPYVPPPAAT